MTLPRRRACALMAACLAARRARAERPPGIDPDSPLSKWFDAQYNTAGRHCCGVGDGHILEDEDWRQVGTNYEVRVFDKWRQVPTGPGYTTADVMPGHGPNPTGKAVVWTSQPTETGDVTVYCFIPGNLT